MKPFGICFISILFLEMSFAIALHHSMQISFFLSILFVDFFLSSIISFLIHFLPSKVSFIITLVILFLLAILFSTQCVFYNIFKVYFSFYNLGLSDQLTSFMKEAFTLIFENILYILLFFIPFIIVIVFHKKLSFSKISWKYSFIYLTISIVSFFSFYFYIQQSREKVYGLYDLYYNVNNISLNVKKIGVINSFYLDIKRNTYSFFRKRKKRRRNYL